MVAHLMNHLEEISVLVTYVPYQAERTTQTCKRFALLYTALEREALAAAAATALEQQQQYKPLMRPPGMPEWDQRNPLECENGTSGTRAGQRLLRSAAPASYSSQHGAGHRGSSQHYQPAVAPGQQRGH
jgi:hypothetical protein